MTLFEKVARKNTDRGISMYKAATLIDAVLLDRSNANAARRELTVRGFAVVGAIVPRVYKGDTEIRTYAEKMSVPNKRGPRARV
jgi:hypothetical protein